ncbi:SDR family oxidoreductase [Jannaschia aquimarina]|uniref:NAD dependent epimerase/dehydratase family protein n=1 Tax=Jannaschia aquimarina TaxID=935700 RepID=A0A0D1EGZ8_9RHOB|nr:SDR family oxidoreductase [Jannaschia aquimarina]KIT15125.1 NAD dependent epimerase/dehydratase family protein [Jannaschia aquimarina]SNS64748.1 Nucleoside-diphosphate-sugar epimerase [Jannaschia aquimarina]
MSVLLSFGHGFSARALTPHLLARGWEVIGTTRSSDKAEELRAEGVTPLIFGDPIDAHLARASHVLVSTAPQDDGDPVLNTYGDALRKHLGGVDWVGYLSTTGVYGDHGGGWVDEETPLAPATKRGALRMIAEGAWGELCTEVGAKLRIFRLAGIYGPGRGPFAKVAEGTAKRIIKSGQVFSRIHVDDIAATLLASIDRPGEWDVRTYNVCDDDPAPPQDVIAHAADLLHVPRPPKVPFEAAGMSEMARSFYAESKRVSNARMKEELGVKLAYPDYRKGLEALLQQERGDTPSA